MATIITSDCISCGACEPECPNAAIYQAGAEWELNGTKHPALSADIFYIVPEKCTECVGFHAQEACAVVCPVDACIPNPDMPETEEQLLVRARQLHPDKEFGADFPSRFREGGGEAPAAEPAAPAEEKPAVSPVAAEAPPAAAAPVSAEPTVAAAAPAAAAEPAAPKAPAPAAAKPAAPAAKHAEPPTEPAPRLLSPVEELEVSIECFRCGAGFGTPSWQVRSGTVLRCPSCLGTYVVCGELHGFVDRAVRDFERSGGDASALQTAAARFKEISRLVRAPGAPRKAAGFFG